MKLRPLPCPRALLPLALAAALAGCAGLKENLDGRMQVRDGQTVSGIDNLRRATELAPRDVDYRKDYLLQRETVLAGLIKAAEAARLAGQFDVATQRAREALAVDPGSDRARAVLATLEAERRVAPLLQSAEKYQQARQYDVAQEQVRRALRELPGHERALAMQRSLDDRQEADRLAREETLNTRAAFRKPVTLQFRDAPIKMIFEALAKVGNLNIIVDRDVKSDVRSTLFVKDATLEDALDVLLLQNQLDKRVLNSNSLLIYPANAAKAKELAELKVRTLQVTNIDATFMANIIKTMVKTRDIVADPKSGTLVIRDTPEAIALAERLVAANDLPDPEVMLEVEVLEVASTRASELGLKLPTSIGVSTPVPATGGLTVGGLKALTRNDLTVTPLSMTLNAMLQDGDATVLASPRIRSRNKEKAKIHVGDKLPIITNMLSPQQSGQNTVVTGSIQYVEVGIKLEVEPQIYADNDVGIKLQLEVSNVTDTVQSESGRAYQIGTRSAQTTLRLRDGETQVLAGLINDADRTSALKVPGLGHLPVVGRLFGNNTDNSRKTEVVLSITPRIVRPVTLPDLRNADAWSGTDGSIRDRALRIEPVAALRTTTSAAPTAAAATTPATAPSTVPSSAPSNVPSTTPATVGTTSSAPTMPGVPAITARPLPGRTAGEPAKP